MDTVFPWLLLFGIGIYLAWRKIAEARPDIRDAAAERLLRILKGK